MGAELVALVNEFDVSQAGHHDNGGGGGEVFAREMFEDLDAGNGGHDEVEEEETGRFLVPVWLLLEPGDAFLSAGEEKGRVQDFALSNEAVYEEEVLA